MAGRRVIESRLRAPLNSLPESTYLIEAGSERMGALDVRPRLDTPAKIVLQVAIRVDKAVVNANLKSVTHDDKRERHVFARAGRALHLVPERSHDVMLASYLLSADGHAHDLLSVAKTVLDVELPEVELAGRGKTKTRLSEVEAETVAAAYGAHAHALLAIRAQQAYLLEHEGHRHQCRRPTV